MRSGWPSSSTRTCRCARLTQLKIDNTILEEEVKRLQMLLKNAESKNDDGLMMNEFEEEAQRDNEELEQMYKMNLEAKEAQIADMEEEIIGLQNDNDLMKLKLDFLQNGMDDLNRRNDDMSLKLEFLDEAKECIRELTNKVNLLTEQKSSLEGRRRRPRPDREAQERKEKQLLQLQQLGHVRRQHGLHADARP